MYGSVSHKIFMRQLLLLQRNNFLSEASVAASKVTFRWSIATQPLWSRTNSTRSSSQTPEAKEVSSAQGIYLVYGALFLRTRMKPSVPCAAHVQVPSTLKPIVNLLICPAVYWNPRLKSFWCFCRFLLHLGSVTRVLRLLQISCQIITAESWLKWIGIPKEADCQKHFSWKQTTVFLVYQFQNCLTTVAITPTFLLFSLKEVFFVCILSGKKLCSVCAIVCDQRSARHFEFSENTQDQSVFRQMATCLWMTSFGSFSFACCRWQWIFAGKLPPFSILEHWRKDIFFLMFSKNIQEENCNFDLGIESSKHKVGPIGSINCSSSKLVHTSLSCDRNASRKYIRYKQCHSVESAVFSRENIFCVLVFTVLW